MVFAIVLAGGNGSRMNSSMTKQRMTICVELSNMVVNEQKS